MENWSFLFAFLLNLVSSRVESSTAHHTYSTYTHVVFSTSIFKYRTHVTHKFFHEYTSYTHVFYAMPHNLHTTFCFRIFSGQKHRNCMIFYSYGSILHYLKPKILEQSCSLAILSNHAQNTKFGRRGCDHE